MKFVMSRVRLTGSTSGYVEITAPAIAGNNTVMLPSTNGSANQLKQEIETLAAYLRSEEFASWPEPPSA